MATGKADASGHRDLDRVVRRLRWVVAAVAALHFAPGAPPAPGASWRWAAVAVAGLALVNLVSTATGAAKPRRRLAGALELAADTVLALAFVWVFRHDPGSPAWVVLVLPVVGGSVRAVPPGAAATWAATAGAYAVLQLAAGTAGPALVGVHAGALGAVALACGILARSLGQEMELQGRARSEAAHRAQLLATVAAAARQLSTLDAEQVLSGIVDSAIELGFDCAEMCVLIDEGRHWRSVQPRGLPESHKGSIQPVDAGVAGVVYQSRDALELADYSSWEHALPSLRSKGLRGVFAAPVWSGGEIVAVLTAATFRDVPLTDSEREAVELLALQASRALENAHRYAERERLERQLTHQAFHDALTGLPNRALLRDRLVQTIARARRERSSLAVIFLDLDGFKLVNDRSGHLAGDELLVTVAARLGLCVRPGDTVARFGGDEFTVLLADVEGVETALAVARRILEALGEPVVLGHHQQFVVSASVGIAWADAGEQVCDADHLLQQADRAMYLAKERGRGYIKVYDAQADRRHEEFLTLDGQLRRSIVAGHVEVHYQPLVGALDTRVHSFEALARWQHPDRGAVPPSVFVPMAERTGSVLDLGRHVLGEAARALASAAAGVRVSVNVSVRELEHPAFLPGVERCLHDSGLDPARLLLELSEHSTLDEENTGVRATLTALRRLGVGLAVDNFGRGACSLRSLRELPVDEIKIDRSLVAAALHTSEDRAIVRWTTELAHELDMRVTAVGVETMEQLRCLRELGCDLVQGFLFHAPRPLAEVVALLDGPVVPGAAHADGAEVRRA